MQRTERQTEIILREQWINLACNHGAIAMRYGASGEEIMQAVDNGAAQIPRPGDPDSGKSVELKRVGRATAEALQRGTTVEHIKSRMAVSLWRLGDLSEEQVSKLMGLDRIGFRKLCDDMAAAQKAAFEESTATV